LAYLISNITVLLYSIIVFAQIKKNLSNYGLQSCLLPLCILTSHHCIFQLFFGSCCLFKLLLGFLQLVFVIISFCTHNIYFSLTGVFVFVNKTSL